MFLLQITVLPSTIIQSHRKLYLNFIKFTRKLLQLEGMSDHQIKNLAIDIMDTRNVA